MIITDRTPEGARRSRRVALASLVGTVVEWYDFLIYGTAAGLVFGAAFFPGSDPATGTMIAFATLGVGFLARPLGGAVAGHLGDRIGRKKMLIFTLALMGLSTTAIGLLPTYAAIGAAAPILLVVLRLLQGFSAGGEWGGAALMSVEHAPGRSRGLWGSAVGLGVPAGLILGNAVFIGVQALTTDEEFQQWGWRIPFLLSILLVAFSLVIRMQIEESPVFAAVERRNRRVRMPLMDVLKRQPRQVLLVALAYLANNGVGYIFLAFTLPYVSKTLGMPQSTALAVILVGAVAWLVTTVLGGFLADRLGRRNTYLLGYGVLAVWAVPYFMLLDTKSLVLMVVAALVLGAGLGISAGPQSAFFAESFAPEVRYSGVSVAFALGAILGGAFAPLIASALQKSGGSLAVAVYVASMALVSFVASLFIRDTVLTAQRNEDDRTRVDDNAGVHG